MTKQRAGGLKRFLIVVLVLFTAIILLLWALAALAPDGGLLPFDYEGF